MCANETVHPSAQQSPHICDPRNPEQTQQTMVFLCFEQPSTRTRIAVTVRWIVGHLEPGQDRATEAGVAGGHLASRRRTNVPAGSGQPSQWPHLAFQPCLLPTANQRPPTCLLPACPCPYRHVPEVNRVKWQPPPIKVTPSVPRQFLILFLFPIDLAFFGGGGITTRLGLKWAFLLILFVCFFEGGSFIRGFQPTMNKPLTLFCFFFLALCYFGLGVGTDKGLCTE